MKSLRPFFLALQFREKILLVAFLVLIVAVWGSNFNRRAWVFGRAVQATSSDLADQQRWLDNQSVIELAAKKTAGRLDPARTLDATSLLATVSSLAAEAGLSARSTGESRDESNGQFNVHTRDFQINRADYMALIKFYLSLQAKSPYIGIERWTAAPDGINSGLITTTLLISAPEVKP